MRTGNDLQNLRVSRWCAGRFGVSGSLTWVAEIERRTPADSTPLDEFFRLLDGFRRDAPQEPAP
ncbi:hypothetical protein ACIQVO_28255 [Streptomyces sp. NPDC101062]|uniref:hypothetical protein n=1 Tax=unclassified Streptomyces TaxID=2593676 RepID=UPI0038210382